MAKFQKGQSGNPGGRPKSEVCLTALLRAALKAKDPETKKSKAQEIIDALIAAAKKEDVKAICTIFDRIDGLIQGPEPETQLSDQVMALLKQRRDNLKSRNNSGAIERMRE